MEDDFEYEMPITEQLSLEMESLERRLAMEQKRSEALFIEARDKGIALTDANKAIESLREQLAQARAQAEHFAELGQEADMQAAAVLDEYTAMRALLEELVPTAYDFARGAYVSCHYCGESFPFRDATNDQALQEDFAQVQHDEDCPIAKARAFLPAKEDADA